MAEEHSEHCALFIALPYGQQQVPAAGDTGTSEQADRHRSACQDPQRWSWRLCVLREHCCGLCYQSNLLLVPPVPQRQLMQESGFCRAAHGQSSCDRLLPAWLGPAPPKEGDGPRRAALERQPCTHTCALLGSRETWALSARLPHCTHHVVMCKKHPK